jgi:hypothetical protein
MAPAVALELTRDAVYGLNFAARLGDGAVAAHLVLLARTRNVTSVCCVGYGASRKLKLCSKRRVTRFYDMECTAHMWPAHKASCKAWRTVRTLAVWRAGRGVRYEKGEGGGMCKLWYGMVWYGAPSTPCQCVPVIEGGGFIQHLPDARSLKQAGQSALVRGWCCLCGRWKLYELLRAHTAMCKL